MFSAQNQEEVMQLYDSIENRYIHISATGSLGNGECARFSSLHFQVEVANLIGSLSTYEGRTTTVDKSAGTTRSCDSGESILSICLEIIISIR